MSKIKINRSKHFTIVCNDVLKDPNLSMQAKGLYAYVMSNTNDWVIYKTELDKHFTNGRDSVATAWKELKEAGWIKSVRNKDEKNRFTSWHHEFLDSRLTENPISENPTSENPTLINNNKINNNIYINKQHKIEVELPEQISHEVFNQFIEHRIRLKKEKKKPLNQRVATLQINNMLKLLGKGQDLTKCIEKSEMEGWADVFEIKTGDKFNGVQKSGRTTRKQTVAEKQAESLRKIRAERFESTSEADDFEREINDELQF